MVIISTQLYISAKGMTINGYNNSTGNNVTVQVTTPGGGGTASRIININAVYKTIDISNITIKGGDISNNGGEYNCGGGIYFQAGTLNLDSVTISGSKAYNGGGIFNKNTSPTLTNCTISGNAATNNGGGIYNFGETGVSSPTLYNCTISGNAATNYGGGVMNHKADSGTCSPFFTNCTISGNSSGDGMFNWSSTPTVTNCTISGNNYNGIHTSGAGSGLYIKNTILANNTGRDYYNEGGTVTDNGYNIVEYSVDYNFNAIGDITGNQANLNLRSTLADNGTLNGTQTLALYYNGSTASVAVDAGSDVANNGVPIPTKDQRGANRNGATDIGAYEFWPGGDDTLPVELSAFTVQYLNNTPTLYWETQSETDNIGWYIYRNNENDFSSAERITDYLISGYGTTTESHSYLYKDNDLVVHSRDIYWYWIQNIDFGGKINTYEPQKLIIPNIEPEHYEPEIPIEYGLQSTPNPANFSTTISFTINKSAFAEISIYNILGKLVKTLPMVITTENEKSEVYWNGKDENGNIVKDGIYLYQLNVDGKPYKTNKLILVR